VDQWNSDTAAPELPVSPEIDELEQKRNTLVIRKIHLLQASESSSEEIEATNAALRETEAALAKLR
jgi:hypothetical protein